MKQNNMNRYKKILSCVLIACLCLGVIPTYVLNTRAAEETQRTASTGQTLDAMVKDGWQVVTPETFGIEDATETIADDETVELLTTNTTGAEKISVDKLLFSANVKFASDSTVATHLYYLNSGEAGRIQLYVAKGHTTSLSLNSALWYQKTMYVSKDGTNIDDTYGVGGTSGNYLLKADTADVQSYRDSDILYWITTEFVNSPFDTDDENTDDLKVGIWINGVLYDNQYFYVPDCSEDKHNGYVKVASVSAISSPFVPNTTTPEGYQMPEGYRVVTPLTFGMPDATAASYYKTTVGETSIDKLLFSANVKCTGNGYLYYLKGGSANSDVGKLQFSGNSTIYFYNLFDYAGKSAVMYYGDSTEISKTYGSSAAASRFTLKPANFELETNFYTEFQIWITTEFVQAPQDTESVELDDLKIGIWINGKLYDYNTEDEEAGTYFYVLNCKDLVYKGFVQRGATLATSSPIMELDHMGMVGGEYASVEGDFYDSTTSPTVVNQNSAKTESQLLANKIMDGTTFQSSVRFEGEGGTLYYGSRDDANAIKLTSTSNGIQVSRGEENIVLLDKNKVGIDVLNKNFDLKLTTQVVNCDDDELTDDVKLGIYVDNKYRSFDLVDATLTATIGVKTTNGATVLFGEFENDDPTQVYCCIDSEVYTQEKADDVTRLSLNGVIQESDFVLDYEGTHSVAITKDGKVSLKDVVVYQSYDIIDDEVVDIKDLVRALKVKNDATREETIAGLTICEQRAIGYVDEETWTADFGVKVLGYMRNALLGDVTPIDQVQIDQVQ